MKQLLVFSHDFRTSDLVTGFLPPGWRVTSVQDVEDALTELQRLQPDLLLVDGDPEEMTARDFLLLAYGRMGLMPPVLFAPPPAPSPGSAPGFDAVGVTRILKHPLEAAELEQALSPYLLPRVLPPMRIAELLASALGDTESRLVTFSPGGAPMGLLLGGGYVETVVHPSFRDLWRARLAAAGHILPPPRSELLEDLLFLEDGLPKGDPALLKLKQQAIELVLQSVPASLSLKLYERRGLSRNALLPIPIPAFLQGLVDRIPEEDLATLRSPSVTVRRNASADLRGLQLTPQEGYLLYQCDQPVKVAQLLQAGPAPASQTLRSLFLLLLLGAVEVEPDAGEPPRLALLADNLQKEQRSIALQSSAIENLANSFQTQGLNPQQILGIPPSASYEVVVEAYDTMQKRLVPDRLHPAVRQKYNRDLLFLNAKVSEAFLMLQTSFLERRHQESAAAQSPGTGPARPGDQKTEKQLVGERHHRESEQMFRSAEELLKQDQVYEATQYLKLALLHDPGSAPAHHLMGIIQGRSTAVRAKHLAEKEFLEAIRLDPWEVIYLLDLAEFYLREGLPTRGRSYLDQAQKISPKEPRLAELRAALRQLE